VSACGVPEDIDDDQHVWRQLKHDLDTLTWDADANRWLPRVEPPAIQFNDDLSTVWAEHVQTVHGAGPELAVRPDYPLTYEALVAHLRTGGGSVEHTPQKIAHPTACAHASVYYPPDSNKPARKRYRNLVARALMIVHGEVTFPPPPGA
jgi:hypothetical protein